VTALPNAGLQTNEDGAVTQFTVKFNKPAPAGGSIVTVSSSNTAEGKVSTTFDTVPPSRTATATGFQLTVPAGDQPDVHGLRHRPGRRRSGRPGASLLDQCDRIGIYGPDDPAVQCVNNDNDSPGITVSKTGGLATTESGGTDTFTVSLNTQPFGDVRLDLSSSDPGEASVSPAFIIFTPTNYKARQVTVTGVDDGVIDLTVPFTIELHPLTTIDSRDTAAYSGLKPPDVSGVNVDDEIIPPPRAPGATATAAAACWASKPAWRCSWPRSRVVGIAETRGPAGVLRDVILLALLPASWPRRRTTRRPRATSRSSTAGTSPAGRRTTKRSSTGP
jgi:hypothetical protein